MEGRIEDKDVKAPNLIERAKEEIEAIIHTESHHHHHKESHGRSDDIDEDTPVDQVRAPGVFERAKEEIEALVETLHPHTQKEPDHEQTKKKEGD